MYAIIRKEVRRMDDKKAVTVFKAFADVNRLKIMRSLRSGEKCACMLLEELNISQPTLSHHMKLLCESGVVESRKEGKWMHYKLSENGCAAASGYIDELMCPTENK